MTAIGYRAPSDYSPPVHPSDAEWDAWTPAEAARRLAGVEAPWAVSAGWAIDLFLGRERRLAMGGAQAPSHTSKNLIRGVCEPGSRVSVLGVQARNSRIWFG